MIGLDSAQAELKYRVAPIALGYGEGIINKGDVVGILSGNNHAFLLDRAWATQRTVPMASQDRNGRTYLQIF